MGSIRLAIYFKSTESIMMFVEERGYRMALYKYCVKNKQYHRVIWNAEKREDPETAVSTLDERYIVLFGESADNDCIAVCDLWKKTVTESSIKCPMKQEFEAVLLGNKERNEIIT